MQNYFKENITQIISLIFLAGMAYSEFRIMQLEIQTLDERLDKKIKIIKDIEKRIDKLERDA
jgi:flagellar biosynthesis chaperone FliJ